MTQTKTKLSAAAEQPPIPEDGYEPQITTSTFTDYGNRLPIGFLLDGAVHREFAFRRFTMKEERIIEGWRRKNSRMSMGVLVTRVLAHMLTHLGPHDFDALDDKQRQLVVNQMWMGDAMYAYVSLRIHTLGPEVKFKLTCPHCENKWTFPADLNLTDVKIAEDVQSLVRRYTLRDGVELPGGEIITDLLLQPPRWQGMASLNADGDMGDVKLQIIASSIRQLGDGKYPATSDVLETMSKWDLEYLQKEIDNFTPGPDLTMDVKCPSCRNSHRRNLDWSWDFFFTASSL